MDNSALELFYNVAVAAIPYAVTWRIGTLVVNLMLDFVTGRSDRL